MIIPTKEACIKILKDANVPANIIAHSEVVCDFAMKVADLLEKKGISVNRNLVAASALLHDIKKLSQNDHIIEGAEFVKSLGFEEVAAVIKKHGLSHMEKDLYAPRTWEEKIVFYADKRVNGSKVVSLDERFEYIRKRYKKEIVEKEINFAKRIEKELLREEKIN